MRPTHADNLIQQGYEGPVDEFGRVLAKMKAGLYAEMTDEGLISTRDEAGTYSAEVRKTPQAPKLTWVFSLKGLVGLRKHGWAN